MRTIDLPEKIISKQSIVEAILLDAGFAANTTPRRVVNVIDDTTTFPKNMILGTIPIPVSNSIVTSSITNISLQGDGYNALHHFLGDGAGDNFFLPVGNGLKFSLSGTFKKASNSGTVTSVNVLINHTLVINNEQGGLGVTVPAMGTYFTSRFRGFVTDPFTFGSVGNQNYLFFNAKVIGGHSVVVGTLNLNILAA